MIKMLKKIKGKVISVEKDSILIEVGALTLEAFPSFRITKDVETGETYNFYASFEMSEYNIALYTFKDQIEEKVFQSLKKVSKIGPKTAAKITFTNDAENIAMMIENSDIKGLSSLPGIGKKTSERIISELNGEFEGYEIKQVNDNTTDVIEALEALGFDRGKILKVLKKVDTENKPVEELIKICLAEIK
ncbi:hypothetical protein E4650_00750 [Geotoga petraea]|uniref:Holliday junction branch migration complex subunit RuvA n=2 Tax=Geotoga petraea TaxID=28234 RepID=A0A4Z0W2H2_9BACT|nr:hypothetical protein E4650_00750 [Geotoga petraea]